MPVFTHDQLWTTGCLLAASGVCLGAFGAHGLRKVVTDASKIKSWETAAHYQLLHSVGILVSLAMRASDRGASSPTAATPLSLLPARLFTAGTLMFSGSIYCLVLNPARFRWMGPITPLGGLCMIGGWVALAMTNTGRAAAP
ncbi:hypothetical protein H9P43_004546 [Blastocladiella emersonii ATCC 22665]|nr:hypothetical protein H9P43_004546 [Blastocladiella emersonii ATCC 22665]